VKLSKDQKARALGTPSRSVRNVAKPTHFSLEI
jgi:hypothetical protein